MESNIRQVRGVDLHLLEGGQGRPLLFLHGGEGPEAFDDTYLHLLSRSFRVIAPWHPGFGPTSRPPHFRSVHDLAYFYLDAVEALALEGAILAGASFGGWIAAEMAVRGSDRFAGMVLIGPYGIKAGDRETRDFVDMFAITGEEWLATLFTDPAPWRRDFAAMSDAELTGLVQSRESLAYYGWRPYMHDPQLRHWLHRVTLPTLLLRGAEDKVVREETHRAFAAGIPAGRFELIPMSGHYPHIEQPEAVTEAIGRFVESALGMHAKEGRQR